MLLQLDILLKEILISTLIWFHCIEKKSLRENKRKNEAQRPTLVGTPKRHMVSLMV